jgi:hypothetical protein
MCVECGKIFVCDSELRDHMVMHTGDKRVQCAFIGCDKWFYTKKLARGHFLAVHLRDYKYECHYCGKKISEYNYIFVSKFGQIQGMDKLKTAFFSDPHGASSFSPFEKVWMHGQGL